jgi:formate dehydrogenase subunit gamma
MSGFAERFDVRARRGFGRLGRTVVHRGELLRHPVYTRIVHWSVAISFVLSLLSGFAIYSPWLYGWLTPLFGGGPTTRLLHPWFGVAFDVFFLAQFMNWFVPMTWTKADSRFLRRLKVYATNREQLEPEETGFFNGGQKLYFWAIAACAVLFLVTGLVLWFDHVVPRSAVAISYVAHDVAAVVMLGGFVLHVDRSVGVDAPPGLVSRPDGARSARSLRTRTPPPGRARPRSRRVGNRASPARSWRRRPVASLNTGVKRRWVGRLHLRIDATRSAVRAQRVEAP